MSPKTLNQLGNFALPVPLTVFGKIPKLRSVIGIHLRYVHILIDGIEYPTFYFVFKKVFAIIWLNETTEVDRDIKLNHTEHS